MRKVELSPSQQDVILRMRNGAGIDWKINYKNDGKASRFTCGGKPIFWSLITVLLHANLIDTNGELTPLGWEVKID